MLLRNRLYFILIDLLSPIKFQVQGLCKVSKNSTHYHSLNIVFIH